MSPRPSAAIYPTIEELAAGWRACLACWQTGIMADQPLARFMTACATQALTTLAEGRPLARGRLLVETRIALRRMRNGGLDAALVDYLPHTWRQRATAADPLLAAAIARRWRTATPAIRPPTRHAREIA